MEYDDLAATVTAAAAGEDVAWKALVDRFNGLLWAVARSHRLSTADAADVVQATWLRLLEHLDTIREPASLGAGSARSGRGGHG
jgi:DNA-directed RNA polymerase specialized sigma24 family protein